MASTIDYRLITRPELCDIVKVDWASDTLPDDGALHAMPFVGVR
jgi:hypothetical protein